MNNSDSDSEDAPMLVPVEAKVEASSAMDVETSNEPLHPTVAPEPIAPKIDPIPITILTGWLGSGKTTLLRHLMSHKDLQDRKIAVIQNEFSALGVEEGLRLEDSSGNLGEYLELPNGCVCCSVKTTFTLAVEELVRKQKFDFIIVECSGLADPGPLATMFWVDADELESPIYLDGLISVVDAKHILSHIDEEQSHSAQVIRQLAFADRIILNKIDSIQQDTDEKTAAKVNEIMETLSLINSAANILPTIQSAVNIEDVLALRAFGATGVGETASKEGKHMSGHVHDSSISSLVLESSVVMSREKIVSWLDTTLWAHADDGEKNLSAKDDAQDIFRAKASLYLEGEDKIVYLQAVQETYELNEGDEWTIPPEERSSKVVIIGKNLNTDELKQGFDKCGNSIGSMR